MSEKKLIAFIAILSITGCSSVQSAKNARGTGEKQLFSSTKDKVWPAMLASIPSTGGSIKEKNKDQCYVLASYGVTAWSWGEKVAVFCQENSESTEVEVVMKAALKTNITAVKRAPKIFTAISNKLAE